MPGASDTSASFLADGGLDPAPLVCSLVADCGRELADPFLEPCLDELEPGLGGVLSVAETGLLPSPFLDELELGLEGFFSSADPGRDPWSFFDDPDSALAGSLWAPDPGLDTSSLGVASGSSFAADWGLDVLDLEADVGREVVFSWLDAGREGGLGAGGG